jgi:hypothetical protein
MNSRVNRFLLALLLTITAIACRLVIELSIGLGMAMTNIVPGIGLRAGDARITWDIWFLLVISVISLGGALRMARKQWGRIRSLSALGAFAIWALMTVLAPESWRGDRFFNWMDRWAAALAAAFALLGFAWLCSGQARVEFQQSRTAS